MTHAFLHSLHFFVNFVLLWTDDPERISHTHIFKFPYIYPYEELRGLH